MRLRVVPRRVGDGVARGGLEGVVGGLAVCVVFVRKVLEEEEGEGEGETGRQRTHPFHGQIVLRAHSLASHLLHKDRSGERKGAYCVSESMKYSF